MIVGGGREGGLSDSPGDGGEPSLAGLWSRWGSGRGGTSPTLPHLTRASSLVPEIGGFFFNQA